MTKSQMCDILTFKQILESLKISKISLAINERSAKFRHVLIELPVAQFIVFDLFRSITADYVHKHHDLKPIDLKRLQTTMIILHIRLLQQQSLPVSMLYLFHNSP